MFRSFLSLMVVAFAVQSANADFIVGGSFTNVGVSQTGGTLNSAVVVTGLDTEDDPVGPNSNTVTMNLDFAQLASPVMTTFQVNNSIGGPAGTSEYLFTINITNSAIHSINGFDIQVVTPGLAFFGFDLDPLPTTGPFAFEGTGNPLGLGDILRIGGLNGGGGELAGSGGTTTVSFLLDVGSLGTVGAIRTFGLNFTANPEPTSLLLASSLLIPGVWFARRRKLSQAATTTPAV